MIVYSLLLMIVLSNGGVEWQRYDGLASPQQCQENLVAVAKEYRDSGLATRLKYMCVEQGFAL